MRVEGFDPGIRIAQLADSGFIARKLTPIRHIICASPAYWDEYGRPDHPDDLKQLMALRYTLSPQRDWRYTEPGGCRGSVTYRVKALIDHLASTFGEVPYWEQCLDICSPTFDSANET